MEHIAQTLKDQFNDPENVTFCTLGRGWPFDVWPLQNGMAYLGKDGGGGLGSGPGISVGSALALHHHIPAATRSRCSATATSAWARPRSGPRCATASRSWS